MSAGGSRLAACALALSAAASLVSFAVAPPAHASHFETFGYGARGTALAGAQVASGHGHASVFYNPANLLTLPYTTLGLTLNLIAPTLTVERLDTSQEPLDALNPGTNLTATVGVSTPIGGWFRDRLAVGFSLYHPLIELTRVESIDPEQPHFYRYQSLPNKLVLAAAVAWAPWDWLRVGVGAQLLAEMGGEVSATVSLEEQRFVEENLDLQIFGVASPTAGLSVGPLWGLRFGVSYRGALELRYELPIRVMIEEIGLLDVMTRGVSLFTPETVNVGLSWESSLHGEPGVTVEAALTWERWSAAPPAGANFTLTVDDRALRADARREDPDREIMDLIAVDAVAEPLAAIDTLTPRVGVEWRISEVWAVRAGYLFRPTPLPRQVHRTNALDASAHVASLGGGFAFVDPFEVVTGPIFVDMQLQMTQLLDRRVDKAAGGSPGGSWYFGGQIWNVSLEVGHAF